MKTSIINIDIDRVSSLIGKFMSTNYSKNPNYIVMNRDTLNIIIKDTGCMTNTSCYETLFGVPIAISDALKFGDVDIV